LGYGSTLYGGLADACSGLGCGTVFELSPTKKGNWMESVLYSFTGGNDGAFPSASLTVNGRNLFGTAQRSGNGESVVFKINH
jgi:hypothetical protein